MPMAEMQQAAEDFRLYGMVLRIQDLVHGYLAQAEAAEKTVEIQAAHRMLAELVV